MHFEVLMEDYAWSVTMELVLYSHVFKSAHDHTQHCCQSIGFDGHWSVHIGPAKICTQDPRSSKAARHHEENKSCTARRFAFKAAASSHLQVQTLHKQVLMLMLPACFHGTSYAQVTRLQGASSDV